jgi:DedD protein
MPWPFLRNEPESADKDAGEGNGRRADARDPAAELRAQTRRRLIGAAALLLAAVVVLPMLLDTSPKPVRDDISIAVVSTPPPAQSPADKAPAVDDEKIAEPAPVRSEPTPPVEASPKPARTPQPPPLPQPTQPAKSATAVQPTAAATPTADRFAVQVAALSTPAAAKDLVARLKTGGFAAYIETVTTADNTLHRVRVGPFASRDEAQRAAEKMKAAGHKATVVSG